jgi:hypothetical protein
MSNNNNNNYSPSSGLSTWHTLLHAHHLYIKAHSNSFNQQPATKKQKTCLEGSYHICVCGNKVYCPSPFDCLQFESDLRAHNNLEACFDVYCSLDCVNASVEVRSEEAAPEIGIFHSHFGNYQENLGWTNHLEHCFCGH